ncbi:DUF2007 domain-containing protein [Mariniflexile sp. HMF6888]|uniref:DUF2007 domain-containing protein n=1 Tax=Mariniflexile sp. HMF6888 TaxID=3373086 RepID=UPI003794E793
MTFVFPTELAVVKSKLESEGIECRVLDEHTVQVHNFLSQAIGGVRLQVAESNLERASIILEENGFVDKWKEPEQSKVEKKISDPKFQKIIKLLLISIVTITIILGFSVFIYRHINRPTDLELLTERNWCIDYIVYQNQEYVPSTISDKVQIRLIVECFEKLDFQTNGHVQFPGFNTPRINGNWKMENNFINISQIDTLDFLLERQYEYKINHSELILNSDSLKIYCSNLKYGYY